MRRIIMTAVASVSLAAPSAALAHNGEHHHHHRGRHHRHAHVLAFHAQAPAGSTGTTTPSGSTPASSDSAGTVVSFSEGTLTVKLNDGSSVSGKVTERTEIECPASTSSSASAADFGGHDQGDDNDRGDQDGRFGDRGHDPGAGPSGDDHHGDCPGHEAGAQTEHCTSAALMPGASVKEAFLSLSGAGAVWVKVELG
jgi:hypothetical protein